MAALRPPKLTLRQTKGTPLTTAEGDANWTLLRDFCNTLADLLAVSLNADGTLKDEAVSVTTAIKDRIITNRKLALDALPFFEDEGGTNSLEIAPDPAMAAYADGMIFIIYVGNENTGAVTLSVSGEDPIPVRKKGGTTELDAGDIKKGDVIIVAYKAGVFRLVAGSSSAASADGTGADGGTVNFTGLTKFEPDAAALPGNGNTSNLVHGLNGLPSNVVVALINKTAEGIYNPGDVIPISNLTDNAGNPAFAVDYNNTNVIVKQLTAGIYAGGVTLLTEANWNLKVLAQKTFNETTRLFPALDLTASGPDGAFSYGQYIYYFARAVYANKTKFMQVDTSTGLIKAISTDASFFKNVNLAPFRFADATDRIVWTSDKGIFWAHLQDPGVAWQPNLYWDFNGNNGGRNDYKPVWLDETDPVHPIFYVVASHRGTGTISSIPARKVNLANVPTDTAHGANADFTNAGILNVAEFNKFVPNASNAKLTLFQYNPVKKRIYVGTDELGLLHIFELTGSAGAFASNDLSAWWTDANRYTFLGYVKTLVLAGFGRVLSDYSQERIAIEFDLATGEEKAICFTRGADQTTGSITRIPWREGA